MSEVINFPKLYQELRYAKPAAAKSQMALDF
jgi:hypothetical protein